MDLDLYIFFLSSFYHHSFIYLWDSRVSIPREPAETRVDRDMGKTDNGQNRGIVDQVIFVPIVERVITMFSSVGQ